MASHFDKIAAEARKDNGTPATPPEEPPDLVHVNDEPSRSEIRRRLPPFDGAYQHVTRKAGVSTESVAIGIATLGGVVRLIEYLQ